jgi:hypothetical protein
MEGMPSSSDFPSYEAFWPYYLAMHSRAATRRLHAVGTLAGAGFALDGIVRRGSWRALSWLPTVAYSFAWPSHFILERNNPATFGHPLWSLRGDVTMIRMMLTGRDAEIGRIAREWLAAHPEDGTAPGWRSEATAARAPAPRAEAVPHR